MTKVPTILNEQMGTIVLYRDDADKVRVSALLKDETLWTLYGFSYPDLGYRISLLEMQKEAGEGFLQN